MYFFRKNADYHEKIVYLHHEWIDDEDLPEL